MYGFYDATRFQAAHISNNICQHTLRLHLHKTIHYLFMISLISVSDHHRAPRHYIFHKQHVKDLLGFSYIPTKALMAHKSLDYTHFSLLSHTYTYGHSLITHTLMDVPQTLYVYVYVCERSHIQSLFMILFARQCAW